MLSKPKNILFRADSSSTIGTGHIMRDLVLAEQFDNANIIFETQDPEEDYQDAGQFYWNKINQLSDEIMFGSDSTPIVLPRHLVQDINTLED